MSQDKFKQFCGDLCRNFDKPWDSVGKKLDAAYPFLQHIPDTAWRDLTRLAMERWERWPTNFVKAVQELYRDTAQFEPHPVNYDPVEDLRFPIGLMHKAFRILMDEGYRPYVAYCDACGMPRKDRDRIEFKAELCRLEDRTKNPVKLLEKQGNLIQLQSRNPTKKSKMEVSNGYHSKSD